MVRGRIQLALAFNDNCDVEYGDLEDQVQDCESDHPIGQGRTGAAWALRGHHREVKLRTKLRFAER